MTLQKPHKPGWWWWRPDPSASWVALEVVMDPAKGELVVSELLHHRSGEWFGEWCPERLETPTA